MLTKPDSGGVPIMPERGERERRHRDGMRLRCPSISLTRRMPAPLDEQARAQEQRALHERVVRDVDERAGRARRAPAAHVPSVT